MRKILLILLLGSSSIIAYSQKDGGQSTIQNDSVIEKVQQVTDSPAKSMELKQWEERNIKAMLQISEQVEKNRAREKRNAYCGVDET
jgi:hypothetical protein